MQYSFAKICINAPFPTTQCGHSSQTELIYEFKDNLYARIIGFKDKDDFIIHISLDLLSIKTDFRELLQDKLRTYYSNDNLHLITSTTHTHYANSVRESRYLDYLMDLLYENIISMEYEEKEDVCTSFEKVHSTACGKSRISGYETGNEYLCLLRFYEKDKSFLSILINNCHPTTLHANVPYFSAEYPGNTLRMLEESHPDESFSFIQGCAGDISSRFVREGQDYEAMIKIATNLYKEAEELLTHNPQRKPLSLNYKEVILPYEHEFNPIDLSNIRNDLSEREMETIKIGQMMREKLKEGSNVFGTLPENAHIGAWDLGSIKLIFYPNEIFSQYLDYLNLNKTYMVSYSNGYGPYILPIGFEYITYEMFIDTLTIKTKEHLIETIQNM
ncbi:MAG: hypothetical protein Q4D13_03770 [Erysipelotrichaceae bacterium]|nr:hypothetical protein [Erysipelotrichaceae bacterium]